MRLAYINCVYVALHLIICVPPATYKCKECVTHTHAHTHACVQTHVLSCGCNIYAKVQKKAQGRKQQQKQQQQQHLKSHWVWERQAEGGGGEELVGAVRVRGAAEVQSSCHLRGLAKKKLQTNKAAGSKGAGRGGADRQWKQLKCANRRLPSDRVWWGRVEGVAGLPLGFGFVSFRFGFGILAFGSCFSGLRLLPPTSSCPPPSPFPLPHHPSSSRFLFGWLRWRFTFCVHEYERLNEQSVTPTRPHGHTPLTKSSCRTWRWRRRRAVCAQLKSRQWISFNWQTEIERVRLRQSELIEQEECVCWQEGRKESPKWASLSAHASVSVCVCIHIHIQVATSQRRAQCEYSSRKKQTICQANKHTHTYTHKRTCCGIDKI